MEELDATIERGRGYLRHQMWDDAVRELESAHRRAPEQTELALLLAEAYEGRWRATDYPEDKRLAGTLAREVVEREPGNDRAFALLARLEGGATATATQAASGPPAAASKLVFVGAALVALGIAGAVLLVADSDDDANQVVEPVELNRPHPPAEVTPLSDDRAVIPQPSDATIPLTLVANEFSDSLAFTSRKSHLDVYPEKSFYRVWGEFEVTGRNEIESIDVQLELLAGDEVVVADAWQAWQSHEATLRPGDHAVFEHLLRAKPEVDAARLTVTKLEERVAKAPYPASKPVELEWVIAKPDAVDLRVAERSAGVRSTDFFAAEWEFTNRGESPLHTVKYEVRLYDSSGKLIDQLQRLATYSSATPIEPGETRLEAVIHRAPAYARYAIAIVQIE